MRDTGSFQISFSYLTLYVGKDDLSRCRTWYTDHLNLKVTWESDAFVMLRGKGGAQLGLHSGDPLHKPDQVQIHFKVDEVDAVCQQLENSGVEIVQPPVNTSWGYRVAVLHDPAGHCVELYHQL